MCRLAVAALGDHVRVEAIEGELGAESDPSHMIETVQALRDRHPGVAFRLLIGSDLAAELDEWREIEQVRKIAPPLVVPRMGYGMLDPKSESPEALPAISSTIVRERVESGQSLEGWVPHAVAQYIRRMDLYGAAAPH
jgi:nicotinate-nucleotide adenylyltransferase